MSEAVVQDVSAFPSDDLPPSGFNELAYLSAFPDVAEAIANGLCNSPLHHYLEHGRLEDRLLDEGYRRALDGRETEGHIDLFGYHSLARGWLFIGWIAESWGRDALTGLVARFDDADVDGECLSVFYSRRGLQGRGRGFVAFVQGRPDAPGDLQFLSFKTRTALLRLSATPSARRLPEADIAFETTSVLADALDAQGADELQMLMSTRGYGRLKPALNTLEGFVDAYGYHGASGGWYFCGWITRSWDADFQPDKLVLHFTDADIVSTESVVGFFPRDDVEGRGTGFLIFVYASGRPLGGLLSMEVATGGVASFLRVSSATQRFRETDVALRLKPMTALITDAGANENLALMLSRAPYSGADTLGSLGSRIFLELDEVIACPPGGVVMMGWMLAKAGSIRAIRLRSRDFCETVNFEDCVRIERPDVISSIGAEHGFDDPRCGFLIFVPCRLSADLPLYLEVETANHQVGYKNVRPPRLEGIAAIRKILDLFDVRYNDVPHVFDNIIGPAIDLLNRRRLAHRPRVDNIAYGSVNPEPQLSIIIPLYGRLDFVEYQMAFMESHKPARDYEVIFVLDDPPKRREALRLFESVFQRFGIPMRLLLLHENLGFSPANNVGLAAANGQYVCFMNSDVFPGTPDGLERLITRLEDTPGLGAVGPLLLYGDGSVQHEGMAFKALNEFGGWQFGDHPRKGLRKSDQTGLRKHLSITGACVLMRRALAVEMGGWDEAFIIGDFEDSDLCLRLAERGLDSAVDLDVEMYHIERRSQASSARTWRLNLTLYNAWIHQRRWGDVIAAHPLRSRGVPLLANGTEHAAQ